MFISETQYRRNPIPGYVMIHSLPSPLFSQVFLDFTLEYRLLIETHLSDSPIKVNHSIVTVCNFIILTFLILRLVEMWNFQSKNIFEKLLRVVQTQAILFLKSMSETVGSDIERL